MIRYSFLLLAACGPGPAGTPLEAPKIEASVLTGDAASLEKLMSGAVVNGGMWFDDAECAAKFPAGEVKREDVSAFARCLAQLHMQPSGRDDQLDEVLVMKYPPGFELEARVIHDASGPRLTWIGFAARRANDPDVPTITRDALESLRLSGDRNGPLDPQVASGLELDAVVDVHAAFTWMKVCLDTAGVATIEPFETTSVKATKAFVAATSTWKFRPFVSRGQPMAVCAMVRMTYPTDKAPPIEVLPLLPALSKSNRTPIVFAEGSTVMEKKLQSSPHILPDPKTMQEIRVAAAGVKGVVSVSARLRVCIDETGHVETVQPLRRTGFPDYDTKLAATMRTWIYSPLVVDGQPTSVCVTAHSVLRLM